MIKKQNIYNLILYFYTSFIIIEIIFISDLFQIFKKVESLRYINEKQLSMIQHKLLEQNLEIEKHEKHFQVINTQS